MSHTPQPVPGSGPIFDTRRFGAVADRKTLSSGAVQSAIDAAAGAGGGIVYCPPGDYLIGSIELKSNIKLYLSAGATLWGSTDRKDYDQANKLPAVGAHHATYNPSHLVFARHAENVAITGQGTVDGQGESFWILRPTRPNHLPKEWRPGRLIAFLNCRNVLVEDVPLRNSPGWMLWPLGCEQVRIHRVRIFTDWMGPNVDGIDVDCCRHVHVSDCHIDTGDDCIALKSSVNMLGETRPCEHVTVTNCTLRSACCAVRLGYEGDGPIRNCTFSNLSVFNSRTGINMLVPRDTANQIEHGPTIANIAFSNIVMDTRIPVYLWVADDAAAPGSIRNVAISDVQATTERASYIGGSRTIPIENVRLSRVDLTVRGQTDSEFAERVPYPYPVFDYWTKRGIPHALYCRHVRGLDLSHVRVHWDHAVGPWRSALRCESVEDLVVDGLVARQGPDSDAAVVHLTDARRAFLRGCRAEPGARRFLRLEGAGTSGIVVIGNHLAEAANSFDLAQDVPADALDALANTGTLE